MKNLPNQLTVSRIVLISVFVLLANIDASKINFVYISPAVSHTCHVIAYIIAIIAGITDWFDGYLARKYKCESDFGRLIVVIVIAREFMVTGLRLLAISDGIVISADKSGKIKTALQMFALLIAGAGWVNLFDITQPVIWNLWYALILIVMFVTLYSGVSYFVKNYKLFKNKF